MASGGDLLHPQNKQQKKEPGSEPPTQKVANEVNGQNLNDGAGDSREQQEEDLISQKISEIQDSALAPVKEDLSEWITRLTGVPVSAETFMEVLDSGIVLCTISKLIEKQAQEMVAQGKITEPLPKYRMKCNNRAKSGTWFARDNTANFLGWCHAYGMPEEAKFDTEDLVSHRQEKPVVNCVLELARIAGKYGIELPSLIRMEKEIEEEVKVEVVKEKAAPPPPPAPAPVKKPGVIHDLDKEVRRVATKCKCQDYVKRIREGVYDIFGKRVFIRLLHGKHLMVRVGGGWNTLENYLLHHDPVHVYEYRHAANPSQPKNGDRFLVIRSKYKSS